MICDAHQICDNIVSPTLLQDKSCFLRSKKSAELVDLPVESDLTRPIGAFGSVLPCSLVLLENECEAGQALRKDALSRLLAPFESGFLLLYRIQG
ncbi:hypothetical protein Hypma_015041 [Hypsizygus marmoreus]|uniref:Uncharacterized protein n=1 Tax=Hypsizygus marmoreus TaxID=39966 RepID=A0A369KBA8_HYPMA|nr:hypothetical protein Hypma_015041 [Hypsizygus marmoreus]